MYIFNFKIRLWYVFLFNVTFYTPSLYTSGSMMQQKVKKNIIGPYRIKTMEKIYFFFFFTWIVIIYEVRNINIKKVKTYIDTTSEFFFFFNLKWIFYMHTPGWSSTHQHVSSQCDVWIQRNKDGGWTSWTKQQNDSTGMITAVSSCGDTTSILA